MKMRMVGQLKENMQTATAQALSIRLMVAGVICLAQSLAKIDAFSKNQRAKINPAPSLAQSGLGA